jgi:putative N-acetyltransferase (TIGR04045 family)
MSAPTSLWSASTEPRGSRVQLECREVASAEELAAHLAVRHQIFVTEQGVFPVDDRDARDTDPAVVHVVGLVDGLVRGAVRLYPLDEPDGQWQGDRLAVLSGSRHLGLGAPLVRFAVRTAGLRGGREMLAHIQLGNVRFFQRLGWRPVGDPEEYVGLPHQRMVIALSGGSGAGSSPTPG